MFQQIPVLPIEKPSKPTTPSKDLTDYERGYLDGLKDGETKAKTEYALKEARDIARLRAEADKYDKEKRAQG